MTLAFECESPAVVDNLHDQIVAAGHSSHLAPFDAFWGQRYATVLDPDGNRVEVVGTRDTNSALPGRVCHDTPYGAGAEEHDL